LTACHRGVCPTEDMERGVFSLEFKEGSKFGDESENLPANK